MKAFAIAALAVVLAAPVSVSFPSPAEAQVLTGRGGDTRRERRANRPPLSEREIDRLMAAEDAVWELTEQIGAIESAAAPTPEQTAALPALRRRLTDEQAIVDRLQAKRDRRS